MPDVCNVEFHHLEYISQRDESHLLQFNIFCLFIFSYFMRYDIRKGCYSTADNPFRAGIQHDEPRRIVGFQYNVLNATINRSVSSNIFL